MHEGLNGRQSEQENQLNVYWRQYSIQLVESN